MSPANKTLEDTILESTLEDRASEEATQPDEAIMPPIGVDSEIVDLLQDFEGSQAGADVRIYRIIEGVKSPGFVFNFPVGSKTYVGLIHELQRRYPDGAEFMMNICSPVGRHEFLARRRFRLEASKLPGGDENNTLVPLVSRLMERMDQRFEAMMERMQRAQEADAARIAAHPPVNPVTQLRELAETLKAIMPAPVPVSVAPSGGGFKDMVEYMDFYDRMRERARDEVAPESESTLVQVLQSLPKLAEMLPALRAGVPALQPSPASAPARDAITPAASSVSATPSPQAVIMNLDDFSTLVPYLEMLNASAKEDHAPDTYAALVLDYLPDETARRLIALPDLQARIEAAYPPTREFTSWWTEFLTVLREDLNDDHAASSA